MKKLFLNEQGKVSFTKVGAWIIAIAQAVDQNGLLPPGSQIHAVLGIVTAIGAALAAGGLRDAIGKKPDILQ